ncbi:hypothetical protein QR680_012226 [Steinernema hermaphroditum]|uniref:Uncharacterized protein n=1 Tax=Steinernema hermaphroditum TaxID=289476 RepID=A0AA39I1C4_9BILA|nr:hypothetical protein QR680_012226 [Steinernema hermaphroditum]
MAESRRDLFCFELIVEKVVRIADDARFAFDAIRFRVADFERETIPLAVPLELEDREASVSVGRSCYFFESEGFLDAISADSLHLELVHSSKSVSACSVFFADFASDGESSTLQCRGAIQMYSPETSARTCQLVITARLLKVETTSSALSARGAPSAPFRSTVCTSVAVQTSHKAKSRGVQVSSSKHMHDRSTQVRVRTIHKEEAACQTETFKEETPKPSTSSVAAQTDVCGSPKVDLKDKRFLKRLIDHLTKEIIGSILKKSRNRVPVDGYTKNSKLGFNVIPRLQMLRTLDRSIDTKVKMEASLQKELHKIRRNTLHELFKLRHEPPMPPYSLTVPITRGPRPMPPLKSQPAKKTVAVRILSRLFFFFKNCLFVCLHLQILQYRILQIEIPLIVRLFLLQSAFFAPLIFLRAFRTSSNCRQHFQLKNAHASGQEAKLRPSVADHCLSHTPTHSL